VAEVVKRPYERREFRLLEEWIQTNYPNWLVWRRVRVGKARLHGEEAIYKMLRRWVDAVLTNLKEVIIVECKIWADIRAVSQLEYYDILFKETPEFEFLWGKPTTLVFLTSEDDAAVRQFVEARGIRFEVFEPAWVKEYKQRIAALKRRRW